MRFIEECVCFVYEDILLEENESCITFLNPQRERIEKVLIDDCVITDGKRCDWLLIRDNGFELYIELKSLYNIRKAFEQLENSILQTSVDSVSAIKYAYIVSRGVGRPRFTTIMPAKQIHFKIKYKTILIGVLPEATIDILYPENVLF